MNEDFYKAGKFGKFFALATETLLSEKLFYIYKQTPKMCLVAVKRDGLKLEHINLLNKTRFVRYGRIGDFKEVDLNVENQGIPLQCTYEEVVLAAVKQNGLALQYVIDQTEEMCMTAVYQNMLAVQFIKNERLKKITNEQIKKNTFSISYEKKYINHNLIIRNLKKQIRRAKITL